MVRGEPARLLRPVEFEEDACLTACRRGDIEAFRPIVEHYQARLYTVALRLTGNRHDAEDVIQEAFERAFRSIRRYDPGRKFSTWLYRIAVNACIDRCRKNHRETAVEQLEPAVDADAQVALESKEARAIVHQALNELPENYRVILVLRDMEGLDYKTIAEILGGSIPALKIRVVRGRTQLVTIIKRKYPDVFPPV